MDRTHTHTWTDLLFLEGFDDAGFMVDYPPFSILGSSRENITRTSWSFWNVSLEGSRCVSLYPSEPWRCILGPEPTEAAQTPLFTFLALYDQVFMFILGSQVPPPNPQMTNFTIGYGKAVYSAMCNMSKPVFVHSGCIHTIAFLENIHTLTINGHSMYNVFVDWFFEFNQLPHRLVENVECYCTRMYNCNPTDPCDAGPGYQNGCTYQPCPSDVINPSFTPTTSPSSINPSSSPPRASSVSSPSTKQYNIYMKAFFIVDEERRLRC
jgi:hypothetical protein